MLRSYSKELNAVHIPTFTGKISMLPFDLADATLKDIPNQFIDLVKQMISNLPELKGIAYLTIDGKHLKRSLHHRKPGIHIDGNFIPQGENASWKGTNGGGGGWKVGNNGDNQSKEEFEKAYLSKTGGMLITSTYPLCKGWNGEFDGKPEKGGNCAMFYLHPKLALDVHPDKGFILKPNTIYYGTSQFVHQSLPSDKSIHRVLVRITLPYDYKPLI